MKNPTFLMTLMLLSTVLCFNSGVYAQQDGPKITVYENPNFEGRSKSFGIGSHSFLPAVGFNDVVSSIKVPAGLVVVVYEHAGPSGGYGHYVDFLEDQPDLARYNMDNKISHLEIFNQSGPDGKWVRNGIRAGRFTPGFWHAEREDPKVGEKSPPRPVVCTIAGAVLNDLPQYRTRVTLYRDGSPTNLSARALNRRYTILNVLPGTYELRGTGRYPVENTTRGPMGLGIFAQGSQAVTCDNEGRSNSVNFEIRSIE